jgi:hypothetical protein
VREQCPMAMTERYGRAFMPVTMEAERREYTQHLIAQVREKANDSQSGRPATADAAAQYSQHIPVHGIAQMIGVPDSAADLFRDWIYCNFQLAPRDNKVREQVTAEMRACGIWLRIPTTSLAWLRWSRTRTTCSGSRSPRKWCVTTRRSRWAAGSLATRRSRVARSVPASKCWLLSRLQITTCSPSMILTSSGLTEPRTVTLHSGSAFIVASGRISPGWRCTSHSTSGCARSRTFSSTRQKKRCWRTARFAALGTFPLCWRAEPLQDQESPRSVGRQRKRTRHRCRQTFSKTAIDIYGADDKNLFAQLTVVFGNTNLAIAFEHGLMSPRNGLAEVIATHRDATVGARLTLALEPQRLRVPRPGASVRVRPSRPAR